jgi:hypothetical protein
MEGIINDTGTQELKKNNMCNVSVNVKSRDLIKELAVLGEKKKRLCKGG